MSLRRAAISSLAALGTALAVTGAAAFACITPASVNLSTAEGRPGDVVTVTGKSFTMPPGVTTGVQVRWKAGDGPLLVEAVPDATGTFTARFTVPDGPPGYYPIVAVLRDASGQDVPGTPGRALFQIRNPQAAPAPEPVMGTFTPADSSGSNFPIAMVTALGVVGLLLFAGGFIAVTRARRGDRAQPAPVRRN